MDEVMNEGKNRLTYQEFMQMMLECYDAFKEVMKKESFANKRIAIQGFNTLQQMIRVHIDDYKEKTGVDFGKIDLYLSDSAMPFSKETKEVKEKFSELKKELEPLVEKIRVEGENARPKKHRKKKMENRLKIKE